MGDGRTWCPNAVSLYQNEIVLALKSLKRLVDMKRSIGDGIAFRVLAPAMRAKRIGIRRTSTGCDNPKE
jgi:hypothetical protein